VSGSPGKPVVAADEVERLLARLDREAESAGYHLNPNRTFTAGLIEGLLVNEKRYGYWACPCRLASGKKAEDLDMICPCDYRDPDIAQYGVCYCGLYVSQEVLDGRRKAARIPDRRPADGMAGGTAGAAPDAAPGAMPGASSAGALGAGATSHPVWRCKVCGYLCARDEPPEVCPICRAKKERFERFL
jgi:ferredoxin-thioredoxin reductase catalytic chain